MLAKKWLKCQKKAGSDAEAVAGVLPLHGGRESKRKDSKRARSVLSLQNMCPATPVSRVRTMLWKESLCHTCSLGGGVGESLCRMAQAPFSRNAERSRKNVKK